MTDANKAASDWRERTVPAAFLQTLRRQPDTPALRWREGDRVTTTTWRDYGDRAARVAASLRQLGVRPGNRVLLLMRNRPEFHFADMGALLAGATPVSVYSSSSAEQIVYLAGHCEAVVAFAEDGPWLSRMLEAKPSLPGLKQIVRVGGAGPAPAGAMPFEDLLSAAPADLDEAAAAVKPRDLATLIYTSGTTGQPKGVMISHLNVAAQLEGLYVHIGREGSGQRFVSFLPMAHIAERVVTHYLHVAWGSDVTCCPENAQLAGFLASVRPHLLFGPPRVWEKLCAGIRAKVGADPEKAEKFEKAMAVGRKVSDLKARNEPLPAELQKQWDAVDAAAFAPLRKALGLDEMRLAFSGAAPIPPEIIQFFRDIGVPMSELYGMSEATGAITWDSVRVKVGTVGRPLLGLELRTLEDGEVVCRGDIVFSGYLNDPGRTAETLDADGWLHSGDIGQIDAEGYLKIVDRKKELIITAGGKNISPANLEAALKSIPLVAQAVAVGDGRPYPVALLVLNPEVAPGWARARGIEAKDLHALAADPRVHQELARAVAEVNRRFSQAEHIRRIALLGDDWTPDSDVLTPTMKLKRRGIAQRYARQIEELYAGGGVVVAASPAQD